MKKSILSIILTLLLVVNVLPHSLAYYVTPDGEKQNSYADVIYGDDTVIEEVLYKYQFIVSVGTINITDSDDEIYDIILDVYDTESEEYVSDEDREEYLEWSQLMEYVNRKLLYEDATSDTLERFYYSVYGLGGMTDPTEQDEEGNDVYIPLYTEYVMLAVKNAIEAEEKKCTITVVDSDDNSKLATYDIRYGTRTTAALSTIETPTKAADSQYSYTFSSWQEDTSTFAPYVTEDITLTAQWTKTDVAQPDTSAYNVYFEIDNLETDDDGYYKVESGDTVTASLYISSGEAATVQAFDIHVINPGTLTRGTITTSDSKIKVLNEGTKTLTTTDAYLQFALDTPISLTVDTPVKIADFPFTVPAPTASGATYSIAISDSTLSVSGNTEPVNFNLPTEDITLKDYTQYTITFKNGDTTVGTVKYLPNASSIDVPDVPNKDGYSGAWGTYDLTALQDQEVQAVYTVINYTITYRGDGVTVNTQTYNIESTDTLVTPTARGGYIFVGWKVTETVNNWTAEDVLSAETVITGKYGNVTLEAVWRENFILEDYRYANTGDKLLIVVGDLAEGQIYTYDGTPIYYTTDSNYTSVFDNVTGVYVYIVSAEDDIASKLSVTDGTAETIQKNGEINQTTGVDIADANIVYQMLQSQDCYTYQQLSIKSRLEADMDTATDNVTHRGSLEDAVKILNIFNGVTE